MTLIKYVIIINISIGINQITLFSIIIILSKNPLLHIFLDGWLKSQKWWREIQKFLQMDESGFHTRWIRGGVSGAIHLAEIRSDWLGTVMLAVNGHSFRAITLHTGRLWTHYGYNGSGTLQKPLCWWRSCFCSGAGTGTFCNSCSDGACSGRKGGGGCTVF